MKWMTRTKKGQKGFSLIELLVAAAVLWIVIGGLYTMLVSGQDISNVGKSQIDAQMIARGAMRQMTTEIRECYEVVSLSTDGYTLRVRGIQRVGEKLSPKVAGSYNVFSSGHSPWLPTSTSLPVIYVNDVIQNLSSLSIDINNGEVTFSSSLTADDTVKANYTHDVYLEYALSEADKILQRKVIRISDGAELENEAIASYIQNAAQSTPVFSQSGSLINITLLIDRDTSKLPKTYELNADVRLRKNY